MINFHLSTTVCPGDRMAVVTQLSALTVTVISLGLSRLKSFPSWEAILTLSFLMVIWLIWAVKAHKQSTNAIKQCKPDFIYMPLRFGQGMLQENGIMRDNLQVPDNYWYLSLILKHLLTVLF